MNKRMREIMAEIEAKRSEAKGFMEGENKDVAKASEIMGEIEELEKEFAIAKKLFEMEKGEAPRDEKPIETKKTDPIAEFAKAARMGFKVAAKAMNEGTKADGGYTVPEDIVTKVQKYREAKTSLLSLVTVTKVNTLHGERTFKKRAQQTGFSKVGEGGKIGAKATPQFDRIEYNIDKYAGYFPVTNEVLADSDENLANILIEWIGDESRVTANNLIIEAIATKTAKAIDGLDGIKTAINVDLGQAFAPTARIVTNDDGWNYLDHLKDATGRDLLAPMPGDTMGYGVQVGARIIPITVIPNSDMPSDTKTASGEVRAPFIIGDLKEGIVYWDRAQMNIMESNVATVGELNAYEEDLTLYRAIEREDVTTRDEDAFINGYINVAAPTTDDAGE